MPPNMPPYVNKQILLIYETFLFVQLSRRLCPFQINVGQTSVVFSIVLLSPDSVNISVT